MFDCVCSLLAESEQQSALNLFDTFSVGRLSSNIRRDALIAFAFPTLYCWSPLAIKIEIMEVE